MGWVRQNERGQRGKGKINRRRGSRKSRWEVKMGEGKMKEWERGKKSVWEVGEGKGVRKGRGEGEVVQKYVMEMATLAILLSPQSSKFFIIPLI